MSTVARHSLLNLAGILIPVAVSLVTVPLYLEVMGAARYGVLAIAWLFLGYFGVFDLGLGRASAQAIAAEKDAKQVATIFGTAAAINIGVGIFGGFVMFVVAQQLFPQFIEQQPDLLDEVIRAAPLLALALPIATLTGVLTGACQGRMLFRELNIFNVLGAVLSQILPLVVAWHWGPSLDIVIAVTAATRLATLIILYVVVKARALKGHRPSFDRRIMVRLFSFGGWVTLSAIVGPMMVILDRFLIGLARGPSAVTHYTVPFQLAERSTVFPIAIAMAIFPRLTSTDEDSARAMTSDAIRTTIALMTTLMVVSILGVGLFMKLWIGKDLANESAPLARILLIGFWFNCAGVIFFHHLQARGRPRYVALCHLGELLPYLFALYVGLQWYGVAGAALVFSVRCALDAILLARGAGELGSFLRTASMPLFTLLAASVLASVQGSLGIWFWLAAGTLVVATLLLSLFILPDNLRRNVISIPASGWRSVAPHR